ncbi:MAG: hypothetical protein IT371_00035 [Deltaproteobacteria bacterium]|nr:hypothetical protein [Deltaproteobacteria bacterium]
MRTRTTILRGWPLLLVVAGGVASEARGKKAAGPRLSSQDLLTWPRASSTEFGCFLERVFRARDRRFNCSLKGYVNRGDPCRNTAAYYEGPAFPRGKAHEVHPLATEIRLAWEHGSLQAVSVTLSKRLSEEEVRRAFGLPRKQPLPAHVSGVHIQACSRRATCLMIEGFDHLGAGDVECRERAKGR